MRRNGIFYFCRGGVFVKKTNWKKASGEVIGFSIALLFLIGFFSQIIGTCVYVAHKEELNEAVMRIGRGIVTEDSMDKAQEKAEKAMKAYMGDREYMPLDEMSISVDYTSGSKKEWTKGNFIAVSMVAHIKSGCFMAPHTTLVSTKVMIEQ